jgi:hypothetical protein
MVSSAQLTSKLSAHGKKKLPDGSPDLNITTHYYNLSVHKLYLLEKHHPDVSEDGNKAGNVRDD